MNDTLKQGQQELDALWNINTYGKEHLMKRMEPILKNHFGKSGEKIKIENDKFTEEKAEEFLKRENVEKELVK